MSEIKNLKKTAQRIKKAVKNGEKIILCGDADLDGVTSVIILKESIKNMGSETVNIYFPDRETEGYGLSEKGLDYLQKISPALLITIDFGISNFKEIKLAKKIGFEVIVIDHHEILDGLPEAKIIVDPKQGGDKYPFKGLATVGIIFKLSQEILGDKMTDSLKKNFLELTALGTIADMMPKEFENQTFIEEGLKSLEKSWRPGIQAFFETEYFKNYTNLIQKVSKIISILNVRDVEDKLPASFRLLTTSSSVEAQNFIEKLLEKNLIRKEKIIGILDEIEERISTKEGPIIFEGSSNWELTMLSSVASIICQKYKKPTFIFKKLDKESQGTVRSPAGINSVILLKKCKKYLLTYGGHPSASGFRIENENLEKFEECLIQNINKS